MDPKTGPSIHPEDAVRTIQRAWRDWATLKAACCTCGIGTAIQHSLVPNGTEFLECSDLVSSACGDGQGACLYFGFGECGTDHCNSLCGQGPCNPRAAVHDFRTGKTFYFSFRTHFSLENFKTCDEKSKERVLAILLCLRHLEMPRVVIMTILRFLPCLTRGRGELII